MSQLLDYIEITWRASHSTTPRSEMENRQVIMSRIGKYPGRSAETIRCNGGIFATHGQILQSSISQKQWEHIWFSSLWVENEQLMALTSLVNNPRLPQSRFVVHLKKLSLLFNRQCGRRRYVMRTAAGNTVDIWAVILNAGSPIPLLTIQRQWVRLWKLNWENWGWHKPCKSLIAPIEFQNESPRKVSRLF